MAKITKKNIVRIIKECFEPKPEERAALRLYIHGVRSNDLWGKKWELEDWMRVNVANALRDMEIKKTKQNLDFIKPILDKAKRWPGKLKRYCPYYETCAQGDVLSPRRPYEVLCSCDKYPKSCKGGLATPIRLRENIKNIHK